MQGSHTRAHVARSLVDSKTESIDRHAHSSKHYRLNNPVALPTRRRFTERRAWDGAPTEHQKRELDDLRKFEALKACDELPNMNRSISATTLLGLKNAGKAHAYRLSLAQWRELGLDGDDCYYARAYLAWVLASQLGHGNEWLIPRHVDMAAIIECCETYAARASRELVARGLVRRTPLYGTVRITTADGARQYRRHVRGPSAFRVPATVLDRIGIRELSTAVPGEKYQASEIQPPRVNPDLRGDRDLSTPARVIDAPPLRAACTDASTHAVPTTSNAPTPTTAGPLVGESSCSVTHSESALEPVAPSAPREGVSDDEPIACATRRAAHLQRTLGEHMDRIQASSSRFLDEEREKFEVATRTLRLAYDADRARMAEATAAVFRDAPRRESVAAVRGDTSDDEERAAYERDCAERKRQGLGVPELAMWRLERKLSDDGGAS